MFQSVVQRQVPAIQKVPKSVEVPQVQHIDRIMYLPGVKRHQEPTFQTEQKTADVPEAQNLDQEIDMHVETQQQLSTLHIDTAVDVPVMAHRQVPLIQRVQKIVEVPQIQFIDKVVDALVSMQRQFRGQEQSDDTKDDVTTRVNLNTSGALAPHRKRKGPDIFQSHRLKAGMKERAQDDDHEHETLCASIASAYEIALVHFSLCDGTRDEIQGRTRRRELIGVLVRKERCAETKAEIAARRLDRLEQEQDEQDDKEHEANLQEALSDKTKVVKLAIDKWFVDRGFGFGKVTIGETVFIHASVVHGGEVLMVGTDAWVQVVNEEARSEGGYRARNACWKEERDREKANRVPQQVRRAAALTAELAAQSEKKVSPAGDFVTSLPSTLRRLTWGRWLAHPDRNDATLAVRKPASSNR